MGYEYGQIFLWQHEFMLLRTSGHILIFMCSFSKLVFSTSTAAVEVIHLSHPSVKEFFLIYFACNCFHFVVLCGVKLDI